MGHALIEIRNLTKAFGPTGLFRKQELFKATDDVTLSVTKGKTLGIVGEIRVGQIHPAADGSAPHSAICRHHPD